ncbi:hypothetical protein SAMN05421493_1202 [Pseudobutyrivibrio sp. 49]|uniref:hypothetical protein n=1 Tax=unclassified Pseudobutyrivibrio TaxID=2638619 RepID=UPI0008921900|nr:MULTISPECIES: hypothetical protein [unclassified Pseudobutyrivibrio]SDI61363.1 hypothetical protein SAMN05421493_1202 [Pseudobutyrivibrio sp. 49]SFN91730.1 hypothetical protein SAMN04487831_1059 [Pseudobutyrivibrio sp. UC1225]
MNGMKKFVAVAAAFAIAVTGFMVDKNDAKAWSVMDVSQINYKALRAPEQDNDINQTNSYGIPYYYEGQTFEIYGFTTDIDDRTYNVNRIGQPGNGNAYGWIDGENDPIPESEDDYILAVATNDEGTISVENGVWTTNRLNAHTYYYPATRNANGELRYKWDDAIRLYGTYTIMGSIFITDESGKILEEDVPSGTIGNSSTFGVKTINSKYSITATSDNESIATVKVDGRNFIIEGKSAGVAHITVIDEKGNEASMSYFVKDASQTNTTSTTSNNSTNIDVSSASTSSSDSSSSSSSATVQTKERPVDSFETVTVNANGEQVRTIVTNNGVFKSSLDSVNDVVPAGASFTSAEIEPTAQYYVTVNEAFKKFWNNNENEVSYKIGKMVEFDLADMSGAAIHQLDGYVTVSMDMPSDMVVGENQVVKVYRVAEDGTVVQCPTVVENGVIQFATNHFSTYVFVVEDEQTSASATSTTKSPKTGEE